MKVLHCILLLLFLFFAGAVDSFAQYPSSIPPSNLRIQKMAVADTMLLDSLSIVPSTFSIQNVSPSAYSLDYIRAILHWIHKPLEDSVTLTYRVFPMRLDAVSQRLRFDSIAGNFSAPPFRFDRDNEQHTSFRDNKNIQYSGSFGRALSFGNNQDAVVNSNFQLQVTGMLKDSVQVAAALTDNNIPIQPDGTTQQLNEFDQVYLQFRKKNWQLDLGDIDIRQNDLYFLNFYKRLQGISFQTVNQLTPGAQSATLVSGSVAKGKFTRNIFQGLEGNQGPYRLSGANKEFFFIVLANTERVYLDGELLQRGEDRDYIINYNTAEITFMPRRMITKDSRIQVEFEYADRNYLNSNLFLSQQFSLGKKFKVDVSAFSNSDAKNSQINQVLDNRQKQFLFELGDSAGQGFYPTILPDSFATDKILYEKVYYTTANGLDSFYRYSPDPLVAKYSLSFTDLGQGNGDYVPDFNGANGKVYRFVEPVNGLRQGRFAPVMVLVTPKKHQVLSLATEYKFSETTHLHSEVAFSNYDQNTFSPKSIIGNQGVAARVQFSKSALLKAATGLHLQTQADVEHVQQSFKPVERLRAVEFSREWGLPLALQPATESIMRFSAALKNKAAQSLTYQFMSYQRSDQYKGFQNLLQQAGNYGGWVLNNQVALTQFNGQGFHGAYLKPVLDVSRALKQWGGLQAGFRYALEKNEIRSGSRDSLSPLSFSFDTYTAYLKSAATQKNKYALNFFTRADRHPMNNELAKADRSYNVNVQTEWVNNPRHRILFNTTYRVLQVRNKVLSNQKDDRTLLGRLEYGVKEWNGMLNGNILYDLGTGQEQRRDFTYLEVPAGQGEFTWIDQNNDGIQQLNEFETAVFRDQAKFIRVFTPTNQFTKANYTSFNYSMSLDPRLAFAGKNKTGWKGFFSKIWLQSSLQKTKKSIARGDFELDPFRLSLLDSSLLTDNTSFINTFSFNRMSSDWGFDVSNLRNTAKALLTYGYESRVLNDWVFKLRWNLSNHLALDVNNRRGENALYTPGFANRNYEILTHSSEPRLMYIMGTVFRLQGSYRWEQRQNAGAYGGERALFNVVNLETKYNVLQSSSLQGRFTFNNIRFDKDPQKTNPNVEYIIMEALRPGSNYLWSLDFTRRLANNVEISFQYEGRRPADTKTIHTGRAAIRALF